jgi:tripartite-type tricarboxylate transporter receptor subunit TctC
MVPGSMFRVLIIAAVLAAAPASAQDRAIRIVLGYPPGATSDTLARLVAEKMRQGLGQPVIVENKPGAAGRIAPETVKSAPADGTTLLLTPLANMVTFPHVYKSLRYDVFRDFVPLAHLANFDLGLAVNANVPAKTLKEYVDLVKKDPKMGDYASAAAGSLPHFFAVMFARSAGIEMNHVPFKGTAPALQALVGGQISAASVVLSDIAQLHRSGKVRALAASGAKRSQFLPEVPTFREQGYDIEGSAWYALYAPAGTPPDVVARLSKAAVDGIRAPDMQEKLANLFLEPTGLGPAQLGAIHKADYDKWGPVIRASGFTPED